MRPLLLLGILVFSGPLSAAEEPVDQQSLAKKFYREGMQACRKGHYEIAIAKFDKAIEINGKYVEAYLSRGQAKELLEQSDTSNKKIPEATKIEAGTFEIESQILRSKVWRDFEDSSSAIADYDKAIEIDPEYSRAYQFRGAANRTAGNLDRALADFTRAIEINDRSAYLFVARSQIRYQLNELPQAINDLDRAIGLDQKSYDAYSWRAQLLFRANRVAEALRDCDVVINMKPDAKHFALRATLKHSLDDFEGATHDFEKALELDPDHFDALMMLAKIIVENGDLEYSDYSKAKKLAQRGRELTKRTNREWQCLWILARAYSNLGNYELAIEHQQEAIRLAPDKQKPTLRDYLNWYQERLDQEHVERV